MAAWGLFYLVRLAGMLSGSAEFQLVRTSVGEPVVLVGGNLYLIILLLYPLEVLRPGWLNLKRTLRLLFPYVSVTLIYYAVLFLLGQKPLKLYDPEQFLAHLGAFNVWYRLLMAGTIVAYLVFLYRLTWRYKDVYRQWCCNNYSDNRNIDILWLRQYRIGVVLIATAYFWILVDGNTYCIIVHNLTVQCFFCYTLYKGLFHDNPYPENFFSHTLDEAEACREAELREKELSAAGVSSPGNEGAFLKKLPDYREEIAEWMVKKKPYLDPDFKLMDVSDLLPLNRTYLSRVFNEGFGDSFSNVVRDYRLREAERLLLDRRDIPVGQVGELCGFSSPSVFHRAFVQCHGGLTPNRYRRQAETE